VVRGTGWSILQIHWPQKGQKGRHAVETVGAAFVAGPKHFVAERHGDQRRFYCDSSGDRAPVTFCAFCAFGGPPFFRRRIFSARVRGRLY
jgi:hypothetical protein